MRLLPKASLTRPLMSLAYPVILGMMSRTLLTLVDTAMVGRLGAYALAAAGLAGIAVWMIVATLFDVGIGAQAVVARRIGERNTSGAGEVCNAALFLTLCVGPIVAILGFFLGEYLIPLLTKDPDVLPACTSYYRIRILEALPFMLIGSGRGFFDGIGHTRVYMRVIVISNILNVILNYVLIFGHFGFPRLEVTGAAMGSTISIYTGALIMLFMMTRRRYRKPYGIPHVWAWRGATLRTMVRLSSSASARVFLALAGFTLFLVIIGRLGTVELAVSHMVINISMLSWMPGIGMGIAVTTIVGRHLGAGEPHLARAYSWEGVRIAWCSMAFLGLLFFVIPEPILRIFTNDPEVIALGAPVLRILGISQFVDPFNVVLQGALQGAGKTFFVMASEVAVIWLIMLPLTWLLAITFEWGYLGAWTAFLSFIFGLVILVVSKFQTRGWEHTKL
jgi:putative MATE family efflux protein